MNRKEWLSFLARAAAGEPITDEERDRAYLDAHKWEECAVGACFGLIPLPDGGWRMPDGAEAETTLGLVHMGALPEAAFHSAAEFAVRVGWQDWPDALKAYRNIEALAGLG